MILDIYNHLPISFQNFICSARGFIEKKKRMSYPFNKYYDQLLETQYLSKNEIEEYQLKRLKFIIEYSNNNVEYYNTLFKNHGIKVNSINELDDIKKIPILTKTLVRENFEKLKAKNYNYRTYLARTSGSTGSSLKFLISADLNKYKWAVWFRHKSRFGIDVTDRYATFTGLPAIPLNQTKPPFWRINRALNQTIYTMHHINEKTIRSIVNQMNKDKYVYLTGYPSILYQVAKLIRLNSLRINWKPKAIFTGAETLFDYQMILIEDVFGCKVTDQYGFSEAAGNASKCCFDIYHEDFEFGYLEQHYSRKINHFETEGEILATGFQNLAMPLIRYQVGDSAIWTTDTCKCSLQSKKILKISGRTEQYIDTPEGNRIMRFDYLFKETAEIYEAQIIQEKLGEIIILMVLSKVNVDKKEVEKKLEKLIRIKISPKLEVKFKYVEKIPRTSQGKFISVINKTINEI